MRTRFEAVAGLKKGVIIPFNDQMLAKHHDSKDTSLGAILYNTHLFLRPHKSISHPYKGPLKLINRVILILLLPSLIR